MSHYLTVIGSGSQGNAILLEFGRMRFILDVGISWRRIKAVLDAHGLRASELSGILLTHDHGDHTKGLRTLLKYHRLPVYGTPGTLQTLRARGIELPWSIPLPVGGAIDLNGVTCQTFPVPHDATEPVGFRFEWQGRILGVATDLGHVSDAVLEALSDTHALCIESNYDEEMLTTCTYPDWLKRRIRGPMGHMPNLGLQHLLTRLRRPLEQLVLIHLSQESNTPEHVQRAIEPLLSVPALRHARVTVAGQDKPTDRLPLGRPLMAKFRQRDRAVQGCFDFAARNGDVA